jgi:preprotein translocase subunit SecF
VHDIIITVGVYSVTQFEVVPATVVAFLTILGYSLYDTVVVFDKVRENQARLGTERGDTYSAMVNRSLNAVLMRSINTSLVAVLPVGSLLIVGTYVFGGLVLRDFALALFVGLLTGAYSSIFVATPLLAWLKEREPRYRALRARAEADLARRAPVPEAVAAEQPARAAAELPVDAGGDDGESEEAPAPATIARTPGSPAPAPATRPSRSAARGAANPRPRQQRGKKRR